LLDECTQKKLAKVATSLYGFTSQGLRHFNPEENGDLGSKLK